MTFTPFPFKTPTSEELTVIFWLIVLIFVGFGIVCFAYALKAPAEQAAKLFWAGFQSIGIGAGIYLYRKFFCGY